MSIFLRKTILLITLLLLFSICATPAVFAYGGGGGGGGGGDGSGMSMQANDDSVGLNLGGTPTGIDVADACGLSATPPADTQQTSPADTQQTSDDSISNAEFVEGFNEAPSYMQEGIMDESISEAIDFMDSHPTVSQEEGSDSSTTQNSQTDNDQTAENTESSTTEDQVSLEDINRLYLQAVTEVYLKLRFRRPDLSPQEAMRDAFGFVNSFFSLYVK